MRSLTDTMFQPDLDAMEPERLRELQGERLKALVGRLKGSRSAYWEAKLAGLEPGSIQGIDDLRRLPFTTKPDLRDSFPFGMLAVPLADTVRVHASSGTCGKPTVVAYTAADVGLFADVNARAIAAAGGRREDVLHVAYGYGLFTGGLGLHFGGERLGATVVPASGGNPGFQVQLLADLGAAGLACTPSFALLLAERAEADGLRERIRQKLRYGVFGAEPWSEAFRGKLEQAWDGLEAHDIYGLSEVIGPGVAAECREGRGSLHVFEDHFYPEVVGPGGEPVPPGTPGELVLTTLTKEALGVPLVTSGGAMLWAVHSVWRSRQGCPTVAGCSLAHSVVQRLTHRSRSPHGREPRDLRRRWRPSMPACVRTPASLPAAGIGVALGVRQGVSDRLVIAAISRTLPRPAWRSLLSSPWGAFTRTPG